ncbi:MAG: HEPN domain-containing protein, partial [candidate division KSB1 bacterium]
AAQTDLFNACAICSYAALFWAARADLAYEGLDRPTWGHGELRSKFTEEFIKNRKRYPANFGTWLSDAFVLRNAAQYGLTSPKTKRVRRMLNHAREFVQKVKGVLSK